MKTAKRIGSLFLVLIMVLSLFPTTAFAEGTNAPAGADVLGGPQTAAAPAAAPVVKATQDDYAFTSQPRCRYDSDSGKYIFTWATNFVPKIVNVGYKDSDGRFVSEVVLYDYSYDMGLVMSCQVPAERMDEPMYVQACYTTSGASYVESLPIATGIPFQILSQPTATWDPSANGFTISWSTSISPTNAQIGYLSASGSFTPVKTVEFTSKRMYASLPITQVNTHMFVRLFYGSSNAYQDTSEIEFTLDQLQFTSQPSFTYTQSSATTQPYGTFHMKWDLSFTPVQVEIGTKSSSGVWTAETTVLDNRNTVDYMRPIDRRSTYYIRAYFIYQNALYYRESEGFKFAPGFIKGITYENIIHPLLDEDGVDISWKTNFVPSKVEIQRLNGTSWETLVLITSGLSDYMSYKLYYDEFRQKMRIHAYTCPTDYADTGDTTILIEPRKFESQPVGGSILFDSTLRISWKTNFNPAKLTIGYYSGTSWIEVKNVYNPRWDDSYDLHYSEAQPSMYVRAYIDTSRYIESEAFTLTLIPRQFTTQPAGGTINPCGSLTLNWSTNFVPTLIRIGYYSSTGAWVTKVELSSSLNESMTYALAYTDANAEYMKIRAYQDLVYTEYVESDPFSITLVPGQFTTQPAGGDVYPWRGRQISWTTNFVPVKVVLGYGTETRWTGKFTLTDGLQKSMNHTLSYDEAENSISWSVRAYYGTGTGDYVASSAFPITKKEAYVCGDNLTAVLSDTGTLTISGTGAMNNYSTARHAPWFNERRAIRKVVISDGATYIGTYAFHLCSNLDTVSFTPSVTQVGSNAVYDCTSLRWVNYDGFKSQWAQITWNYGNAGLQDAYVSYLSRSGTVDLGSYGSFSWRLSGETGRLEVYGNGLSQGHVMGPWLDWAQYITELDLSVDYIWDEAFRECYAVQKVYLSDSLVSVDTRAFSDCTQITNVYYNGPLSDWEDIDIKSGNDPLLNARLHTVAHEEQLTSILMWSVDDEGLLRIWYDESLMGDGEDTDIPDYTYNNGVTSAPWFADYADDITAVRVEKYVTRIGNNAFRGLENLYSVEIADTVTDIGILAFYGCTSLFDITLQEGLETIGSNAFTNCSDLEVIRLPDSVTTLGAGVFRDCGNLEYIWLPANLTAIPANCFMNCRMLSTRVEIPATVTSIGSNAFLNCTRLATTYGHVYYGGTSAQWKDVSINATGNTPLLNAGNMHFTPPELAVNAVNFPDAQFRTYVANNFDTDGSGYLTDAERNDAADVNDEDNDYGSLQGIEYFPNLTGILIDAAPSLTSVDLSGNPELTYVDFSDDHNLSEINLSGLTELRGLYVSGTAVAELDLNGLGALNSLSVSFTPITALDLRQVTLSDLYCGSTPLTALDLSGQSDLYRLYCYNTGITELDLSDCPLLLEVLREGTRTEKTIDGVPCVEYKLGTTNHVLVVDADVELIGLDELPIDAAHFPDADFRASVAYYFDTNGNGWLSGAEIAEVESISMDSFDELQSVQGIEYFTELTSLELTNNANLTAVDLSANTKLTYLDLGGSSLTSLDLTGLTGLTKIYVSENQLHFLDVSGNPSLSVLSVDGNPMGALILGNQPNLKRLDCYGTGGSMKVLDIRDCPYLLYAYLYGTKTVPDWGDAYDGPLGGKLQLDAGTEVLTPGCISVDVTHFPDPVFLNYIAQNFDTNLTQWLTPEEIAAVTVIDVQNQGIADLAGIEYFPALESLTTLGNPIRSLDLSGNPNLRELYCTGSQLSELDLSHTPNLEVLSCLGNSITSLDLTPTPKLVEAVEEGTREEFTDEGYDGWFYRKEPYRLLVDKSVELIGTTWQPDYDGILPAAMKSLEEEALAGCAFQAVRIPDGAVKIGSRAFADSPNLKYVYIPESVTEIAADAFDGVPAGLTIIGAAGSLAESFASAHGFMFAAA